MRAPKEAVMAGVMFLVAILAARAETVEGILAEGTKWEMPYYVVDSGVEGPTVFVTGGLHGNEPAGYRAAEQVRRWPIVKGRLVVIPRANVPGLAEGTRYLPGEPESRRDMNRNFPSGGEGNETVEGVPATAVWNLVMDEKPDWLLDLHEGSNFHISHEPEEGKKKSVGSSVIYQAEPELDAHVEAMLAAVNELVEDPKRRFVPLSRGQVAGSLARAAQAKIPGCRSFLLDTTYHFQPISLRAQQHRAMVNAFLLRIGMIEEDCRDRLAGPPREGVTRVAFFDGPGTGPMGKNNIPRILDQAPDAEVHYVGAKEIRPEVLAQFEVVIFPGGSGSKQAAAIGEESREQVKRFVEEGGGYLGVCAGAYLCTSHYSWSLGLVDASVFTGAREIPGKGKKQMWYRGKSSDQKVELTDRGAKIFDEVPRAFEVRYANGPIISPGEKPDLEDYQVLAYFRSEKVLYEPQRGTMIDTPAMVAGRFGKGRVISISPHPESSKALESVIVDAVRYVAGGEAAQAE